MKYKRNKIILLSLIGMCILLLFSLPQIKVNFNPIDFNNDAEIKNYTKSLKSSSFWELTSPIEIDDTGVNNWTWAEGEAWFGGGNGAQVNPYIIENVTIDVDNTFEYCIDIQNSSVYFIINNCTV
ncbi:MAG: hypothetical protein HWN80_17415, partial [Candidatus Lokiarchaeota archaeon]|nr:hypothetical protein [Candidatus Lokiarchaeota archaeon]